MTAAQTGSKAKRNQPLTMPAAEAAQPEKSETTENEWELLRTKLQGMINDTLNAMIPDIEDGNLRDKIAALKELTDQHMEIVKLMGAPSKIRDY